MKPINEMNLSEMADYFDKMYTVSGAQLEDCADRLRELHELTRWIPVEERMPTEADADKNGRVLWYCKDQHHESLMWDMPRWKISYERATHWKRIDKP